MTLPRNFPGRVNARRIRALNNLPSGSRRAEERAALEAKIVPDNVARGNRTKKDHSHMAKLRSAAR